MAWYKCGGGGALKETVLWTNPSPTSNLSAADQPLSQSINNFKKLVVYYKVSKSDSAETYVTYDVEEFKNYIVGTANIVGAIGCRSSSATYARAVYYVDDTTIRFGGCSRIGTTASTNDSLAIPTKVCGLK